MITTKNKQAISRPKTFTENLLRGPSFTPLSVMDTTALHALVLLRGFWKKMLAGSGLSYAEQYRKVLGYYKRLQAIVEIHGKVRKSVATCLMTPAEASDVHDKALSALCKSVGLDEQTGSMPFRPGEPDTVERTAAQLVQLASVLKASAKQASGHSGNLADDMAIEDIWRTIWIPPEARAEFVRDSRLTPANVDCKSGPTPSMKDVILLLNAVI